MDDKSNKPVYIGLGQQHIGIGAEYFPECDLCGCIVGKDCGCEDPVPIIPVGTNVTWRELYSDYVRRGRFVNDEMRREIYQDPNPDGYDLRSFLQDPEGK